MIESNATSEPTTALWTYGIVGPAEGQIVWAARGGLIEHETVFAQYIGGSFVGSNGAWTEVYAWAPAEAPIPPPYNEPEPQS